MSTLYTLDKLREDVDREFAPLKIAVGNTTYVLRNLLRIDETDRDAVMAAMKDVEAAADDEDAKTEADLDDVKKFTDAVNFVLATVTADGKGTQLVEAFDGDMMLAMRVLELWSEATQPGSAELARLIDRCGEEITADLQQYYGLDISDVLHTDARLSPRRALVLIRQLPPESATVAALRGGSEFRGWGPDRYLTAQLIDSVRENTYVFIAANSKRKPRAPEPVERPERYAERTRGKNSFRAMANAVLGAGRAKKGT